MLEADDLPIMDRHSSDPYVEIQLVTNGKVQRIQRTKTVQQSLQPVWNESFAFGGHRDLHGATSP